MKSSKLKIALYLNIRILLMISLQGITFLILRQSNTTFESSGFYWGTHITIVNFILWFIMIRWFKTNNGRYFDFFKQFSKDNTKLFVKILIPLVIISMAPNIILSIVLYQNAQIGTTFLLGDIPLFFMIINLTIFPLVQGIVELPFYYLFIMPKIQTLTTNRWIYIGLPVFFLSIQHAFMPFRLDLTYGVYRSLMFLPFALFIGLLINKKPSMMAYLVILHILMNASLFMMYFID